jgi:hypothetical protein
MQAVAIRYRQRPTRSAAAIWIIGIAATLKLKPGVERLKYPLLFLSDLLE